MDLYLVRHAAAVSRADWDGAEPDRPLKDSGREDMARVASSVARLGLRIDHILTSPYARSYETAEILAHHLNLRDKMQSEDALAPGFSLDSLGEVLEGLPEREGVVLVGHEPDLSGLVEALTGGKVTFKKGALARIRLSYPSLKRGELNWLVQPGLVVM